MNWANTQIGLLKSLFKLQGSVDRGGDRLRRAGLTGLTSTAAKGLGVITGLISVPLTTSYLGQERYGVWLTMSSLLTWLAMSDMGFGGNALVNALAETHGQDDRNLARELVATAFWGLTGIAVIQILLFALALPWISWPEVFKTSAISVTELRWAAILSFASFVFTFPLSLVGAIYTGYQEGYVGNLWGVVGNVFSLVALIIVTRVRGGLPELVLALSGTRIFVTLLNAGYLFIYQRPWLFPVPRAVTRRSLKRLMSLGLKYLIAQFATLGMFQSQPMIITQVLGPIQVGIFNVAYKLLSLPLLIIQMFTFPLMPAYGEAKARRDELWIRRTLWRSVMVASAISLFLVLPIALLSGRIIRLWVGPSMIPDSAVIWSLAIYAIVNGIQTPISVMFYGIEKVGGQAVLAIINSLLTVGCGIILTNLWGLPGMGVAMVLGFVFGNVLGQLIFIGQMLRTGNWLGSKSALSPCRKDRT